MVSMNLDVDSASIQEPGAICGSRWHGTGLCHTQYWSHFFLLEPLFCSVLGTRHPPDDNVHDVSQLVSLHPNH